MDDAVNETVTVDEKGRIVLPKKVREKARIKANSRLVAEAKGEGRIELFDPDLLMMRAQEIGSRKLADWREEDHEAAELLSRLMKEREHEAH
jgi:AbrB family looped-hinge helix DNA binding protein